MFRRGRAVIYHGLKWAARRPSRICGSSEFGRKDFFADNFDAAYGTWLHPGTKKPFSLYHWFMRQADFKYVTGAAVNSSGVPKTDHRLVRLDLVFKFMPRRQRAVKPRIDPHPSRRSGCEAEVPELCGGLHRCGSKRPVCCAYHTIPKAGCAYAAARSSGD